MTTTINFAPLQDPIVDVDQSGKTDGRVKKSWFIYFNTLADGDQGTDWTPVATNLTGTNTLVGKYFRNAGFIDLWITVDTSTTSGSTLGSTYFELPFDVTVASACDVVYASTVVQGIIDPSTNRLFSPTWSTSNVVTITARVFTK